MFVNGRIIITFNYFPCALHKKAYFLFPNILKKWSFQKNRTRIGSFLYYQERWYFFFLEIWFYSLDRKWKMIFLKKYMEIWYLLYICINVTNMILSFCQKNQRRSSPQKVHLKVIHILDSHSKKSSNDSLYFYGDLHIRFHISLSSEKNPET